MNLVEVFKKYGRIPNALTTEFLSHPQPPFEALAAADFREGEGGVHVGDQGKWGEWYDEVMKTVEEELFTEWWDHGSGRIHPRQDTEFYKMYKPYMTRYVSVHFHPLLVGC
jgi:neutral trehalase